MSGKALPRVAILFSGAGSNMAYILEHLHGSVLEVVLTLTDKAQAGGIEIAEASGIPCRILTFEGYESREAYDAAVVELLHSFRPDLTILAGFMRILTPVFTDRIRAINLHPSLLPKHKGLHAIERSYADASPAGGVSVHWVSSELDGGELIRQREIAKEGLSLEHYDKTVRRIEKEVLAEGIEEALKRIESERDNN